MKILFIGPLLPPIHGQSLAFTRFYESVADSQKFIINTNLENTKFYVKIAYTLKTFFLIFFKIIFNKIDVVYFTCSRSFLGSMKDIFLINLASFRNIRLINHLHGSDFYEFLHTSNAWYKQILLYSYNKVETSIVLLDSMKSQFCDFHKMNIEVVSNFYDKELDKSFFEKDNSKINLLYLSNIIKSKGVLELVDAFNELSKEKDNIYLNIAGGFMGDKYLSSKNIEKQLLDKIYKNPKINYLGKVFGKEKVELLQISDIFVLPSYYMSEAFPISVIEAMATANAIVTTNFKYLPEVVSKNSGVVVEVKSIESLKDGIESLLNNIGTLRKMQNFNKQLAKEKYSLNQYIVNLYKIVLKK